MRIHRPFLLGLLAALAVVVAGCGGAAHKGKVSSTVGATMITSNALAYATVSSDLGSSQWKQVDALSQKFPGRDKAIAQLKKSLSDSNVDYNSDIKPALGSEVDVAVAAGATLKDTAFAALTKPDDPAKFKALVAKMNKDSSGSGAVYREIGNGWYARSQTQQMINRVVETDPGGALADSLQTLMKTPQIAPGIKQFEQGLGLSVNDILDLFRNEVAFYARPGTPIPEFTLVLESSDEQKAMGTIDKLFTRLGVTG